VFSQNMSLAALASAAGSGCVPVRRENSAWKPGQSMSPRSIAFCSPPSITTSRTVATSAPLAADICANDRSRSKKKMTLPRSK